MENYYKDKEDFVPSSIEEMKYHNALKRVKKIKGFYTHLIVFVVINCVIIFLKARKHNTDFFSSENFSVTIFWGIGLVSHALSVFLPNFILGANWEERKINEIIEKEKKYKQH